MDGTLRAGYTVVAKFGTGIWNQSGGLFNQNFGDFEIGDGGKPDQTGTAGPRNGIVNISGGILQTADSFAIGNRNGTGMVDIRGAPLQSQAIRAVRSTSGGGMNWEGNPGAGGPVGLRVAGDQSTIVANGDFLMNTTGVASSSTLVAEITGSTHTTVRVAGAPISPMAPWRSNSIGYAPASGDSWTLIEAGADVTGDIAAVDAMVTRAGTTQSPTPHRADLAVESVSS